MMRLVSDSTATLAPEVACYHVELNQLITDIPSDCKALCSAYRGEWLEWFELENVGGGGSTVNGQRVIFLISTKVMITVRLTTKTAVCFATKCKDSRRSHSLHIQRMGPGQM